MYEDHIMRLARQNRPRQQQRPPQQQKGLESLMRGRGSKTTPVTPWGSAEGYNQPQNIEKEWRKAQMRLNEPSARRSEQLIFEHMKDQGKYPWNLEVHPGQKNNSWMVGAGNVEDRLQAGIFNTDAGHEMLADSYAPQHLLQMYHDALDAGNEDEAERLLFDIQLRYPQLLETRV